MITEESFDELVSLSNRMKSILQEEADGVELEYQKFTILDILKKVEELDEEIKFSLT